ncbi:hypothetical protein M1349_04280 [Patescibacteria group bacterium]|nr:hypothetical protein [Patescibacteria group bacterium]
MHLKVEEKMNELKKYKKTNFPVLSVYLGYPDTKTPTEQMILSQFHSLVRSNLSKRERENFKFDIEKIESFIKEAFDSRGKRSVVFFSGGNLWEVLDFEYPLPSSLTVDNSLYLKPIVQSLTAHKKYLVLLVDREKARLFTVHLGKIEEYSEIFDASVPQKVRANEQDFYGRSDKIFRHIEDHLNRHLKLIASRVADFVKGKDISFIVVGGHKDLFKKMGKHLNKNLQKKLDGTFVTELNIPINDVFLLSKEVLIKQKG